MRDLRQRKSRTAARPNKYRRSLTTGKKQPCRSRDRPPGRGATLCRKSSEDVKRCQFSSIVGAATGTVPLFLGAFWTLWYAPGSATKKAGILRTSVMMRECRPSFYGTFVSGITRLFVCRTRLRACQHIIKRPSLHASIKTNAST